MMVLTPFTRMNECKKYIQRSDELFKDRCYIKRNMLYSAEKVPL